MSTGATIEASLRLQIAQYEQMLVKANTDIVKFKEQLRTQGKAGADALTDPMRKAHAQLEQYARRTAETFSSKMVNPWATASAGAAQYATAIETKVIPAMQKQAAAWKPRTEPGFDTNRILAEQAMSERIAAQQMQMMRRGGGARSLGMIALQAQDIAVQMQMGTRMSVIAAQQGSQMLSAFGAKGAVAGGVLAIGAAFITMGQNARAAFETALEESKKMDVQVKKILAGGGVRDLADAYESVSEAAEKAGKSQMDLQQGWSGIGARVASWFGGPSVEDRDARDNAIRVKRENDKIAIQARLLEMSKQEVAISRLAAAGENEKAEAMKRELRLAGEIARINAMDLDNTIKAQLITDAQAKSAAEAVKPRDLAKEKEELLELENKIHDQVFKSMDPLSQYMALWKEQETVFDEMTTKGGLFFDRSIKGLEAWAAARKKTGDLQGYAEILKLLQKARELDLAMVEAGEGVKRDATQNQQRIDEELRAKEARKIFDIELKIAKAKAASGQDDNKTIQAFRDQINTLQLQESLQDRLKISKTESLKLASEMVVAERAAADAIKAQSEAEKSKQQLRSRQHLAAEAKVDALRAAGRHREADDLQRKIKLADETQRIAEDTGLDERQAAAVARQRLEDQERAADRAARAAGIASGQGYRRKIKRSEHYTIDPEGRYGLSGRPSTPLADVGPLSSNGPLSRNGGLDGYTALQLGMHGNWRTPSAIGMGYMRNPLAAQHQQNSEPKTATNPASTHQQRVEQQMRDLIEAVKKLGE